MRTFNKKRNIKRLAGIILAIKEENGELEYLIVCRAQSEAFVNIIRNIYKIDKENILKMIEEFTISEMKTIKECQDFEVLRKNILSEKIINNEKLNQSQQCAKIFIKLKNDIIDKINIEMKERTNNNKKGPIFDSPEFGFPKGFVEYKENYRDASIREFEEETGLFFRDTELIFKFIKNPIKLNFDVNNISYEISFGIYLYNGKKSILVQKLKPNEVELLGRICKCCNNELCENGPGIHILKYSEVIKRFPKKHNEKIQALEIAEKQINSYINKSLIKNMNNLKI